VIHIILKNEALEIVDEIRLHEDHHHVLIASAIASAVKELLSKHRENWRNIEIKVY
jgi:hypothetical protein